MARWKPVYGYEGFYEVSDQGRVRSVDRIDRRGVFRKGVEKAQPANVQTGYKMVSLWKDGVEKQRTVHSVVIEAFEGPRPEGAQVCHNDGTRDNNALENLRYDTPSGNVKDRRLHGTDPQVNKTHCPRGHPLREPNLVPAKLREGIRECQTCSYVQSKISRQPGLDREKLSEGYLTELVRNPLKRPMKEPGTCRRGHRFTPETEYWRMNRETPHRECRACIWAGKRVKGEKERFELSWKKYREMTGESVEEG